MDGDEGKRITLRGNGGTGNRQNVILRGAGTATRVLEIKHDYYTVEVKESAKNSAAALVFCFVTR